MPSAVRNHSSHFIKLALASCGGGAPVTAEEQKAAGQEAYCDDCQSLHVRELWQLLGVTAAGQAGGPLACRRCAVVGFHADVRRLGQEKW